MPQDTLNSGPYTGTTRNPYSYQKIEQVNRDTTTSWLTLEEVTQQLNLDGDESQDSYLTGLEVATRMAIEDYLGMAIQSVSYRVYYGATSSTGTQMCLDLPEVSQNGLYVGVTIDSVGYWNFNDPPVFVTLTSSDYYYDNTGNKVIIQQGMPNEVNTIMTNPIVVTYTLVPNPVGQYPVIKQAGLLLLTHLYNNRSDTTMEVLHKLPFGVEQLLRPYKPLVM